MSLDPFPDTYFTQAVCIQSTNCSSLNGVIWDECRHRFQLGLEVPIQPKVGMSQGSRLAKLTEIYPAQAQLDQKYEGLCKLVKLTSGSMSLEVPILTLTFGIF